MTRWSGPLTGGLFAAGVGAMMSSSQHPYPRPGSDLPAIRAFFAQRAPRFGVAGQLASATALAVFTRGAARTGGRPVAAGGALAAASLGASAACSLALTTRAARRNATAARLHRAAFWAGGLAHNAGFGLLLAGLGRSGALPAPLGRAATGLAVPNLLSPATLVAAPAAWLIPIGRFPGLVVVGMAGRHLED